MKPLQAIAMGFVIIALGAKVNGYDILADPLGWLLVIRGVSQLPRSLPWRDYVFGLAAVSLLVSVPLWFPTIVDDLAAADDSLLWAVNLAQIGFVSLLCAGLARAATETGDRSAASWLKTACTLSVVAGVLPILVYTVETSLLVPLLFLAVVTLVMVIVLLFTYASRPWALPEVDQTAGHAEGVDS